jgi:hypothetical protein
MALKRKAADKTQVAQPYEPILQEHAVAKTYFGDKEQRPPCPDLKVSGAKVTVDHHNERMGWLLLSQALGGVNYQFAGVLVSQLANTTQSDQPDSVKTNTLNFMLAAVKAIEPKNEVEAMLAAQMAAIHGATMRMASRLARRNWIAPSRERRAWA